MQPPEEEFDSVPPEEVEVIPLPIEEFDSFSYATSYAANEDDNETHATRATGCVTRIKRRLRQD